MRLLLVEDEPKLAQSIRRGLEDESFVVDVVHDGAEALDHARRTAYDLLILDVMLPGMDGFTVCRTLRESGSAVPILILSARGIVEDRVKGLELGADDYLTKPFAYSELSARIRTLLRRGHGAELRFLQVANLTFDPITRVVKRGERRLDLTQKEAALLEFLMRHAGQPLTRAMIAEQVWDSAWHGLTNVIDVYINHLRKKVDADGEPPLIYAVRGTGYVIRESAPQA